MFSIRLFFISISCFLSLSAYGLTDGKVLVDNLNLRKLPDGEIIGKLEINQKIRLVKEESGWSQILYLNEDTEKALYGWVSTEYIELQPEKASTECIQNPQSNTEYCLTVMKPDLQCQMDEKSNSFSACSVDVRYELSGNQKSSDRLGVLCTSNMKTREHLTDGWQTHTQTLSAELQNGFGDKTSGNIEIPFDFMDGSVVKYFGLAGTQCLLEFDERID